MKALTSELLGRACHLFLTLAYPGGEATIGSALAQRPGERVLLAIGPEGGWNAFELALLQRHGFRLIGLGPRPLRVDTACTALLAMVHASVRQG